MTIVSTIIVDNSEIIKPKRGRKSKKELMASLNLNIQPFKNQNQNQNKIPEQVSLQIIELNNNVDAEPNNIDELYNNIQENVNTLEETNVDSYEQMTTVKKRGRKPKGGKIVQQVITSYEHINEKPNVILHLKCSMKDLQCSNAPPSNYPVKSFSFIGKNDLCYEVVGAENINANTFYNDNSDKPIENLNDESDDEFVKDNDKKEIWKKLKQLEHNLHVNNVHNKKSACFWDTCTFDNPPIYIPKHFINGTYQVYGCFCSPECAVAHLMNECIDSSAKFERYHLLNNIYSKIYDYKKSIKPAPNPFYMLEKYYGNLTIQEYRSLLRNERLFLIVDKPLTRILPELHEDNDDFILNNKIIPSNNYQVKTRLQRKKQNKNYILNEKFGINEAITE
jgi:hypothetical protein